ncbi:uncharacterized protein RJT21DRAFT_46413 [Scheffersomyces amazonensis]|uniref:uncharacterized protein n=1 Tax=Scheffersomyces amazonensis TaxID=1078765 RepID=UPI00315E0157
MSNSYNNSRLVGTKSRLGCLSCKKLRIKCNEAKPSCEYCQHTNRECIYPDTPHQIKFKPYVVKSSSSVIVGTSGPNNFDKLFGSAEHYFTVKESSSQQNLVKSLALNQTTTQLNLSTFELRLLNFFHNFCIFGFTFGQNPAVHDVWANKVPKLFIESQLVRDCIFAYACINLFPFCDLEQLKIEDNQEIRRRYDVGTLKYHNTNGQISKSERNKLFVKTSEYFSNSISSKNALISKHKQLFYGPYVPEDQLAKELVISSILIFGFLGLQPHDLVPLVCFDGSEADYLNISQSLRNMFLTSYPAISTNEFSGIFVVNEPKRVPSVKESTFPLIINLKRDLEMFYPDLDKDNKSSNDYDAVLSVLELLQICIYRADKKHYTVPLFRWLVLINNDFCDLVHEKNFYALRILFVYSCLCNMARFQLYYDANLWINFVIWFRNYNYELFGLGNWKYNMDRSLFNLIHDKYYTFYNPVFSNMTEFDPEFLDISM